jgi:hypothetical protein
VLCDDDDEKMIKTDVQNVRNTTSTQDKQSTMTILLLSILLLTAKVQSFVNVGTRVKDLGVLELQPASQQNVERYEIRFNSNGTEGSRRTFLASMAAVGLAVAVPEKAAAKEAVPVPETLSREESGLPSGSMADAAVDWNAIFTKASKKALGGGKAGASAAGKSTLDVCYVKRNDH